MAPINIFKERIMVNSFKEVVHPIDFVYSCLQGVKVDTELHLEALIGLSPYVVVFIEVIGDYSGLPFLLDFNYSIYPF